MQAGVFSSEYNAKEMLKTLSSNCLRAIMEPLNYIYDIFQRDRLCRKLG
ncbi:hypothetical protein [Nostoc sp.]